MNQIAEFMSQLIELIFIAAAVATVAIAVAYGINQKGKR